MKLYLAIWILRHLFTYIYKVFFFFRITILYMNCVHEYSQSYTKPDLASFNQLSHVYTRYKNITFLELWSCCYIIYLILYQAFSITKIVQVAVIELQIFFLHLTSVGLQLHVWIVSICTRVPFWYSLCIHVNDINTFCSHCVIRQKDSPLLLRQDSRNEKYSLHFLHLSWQTDKK